LYGVYLCAGATHSLSNSSVPSPATHHDYCKPTTVHQSPLRAPQPGQSAAGTPQSSTRPPDYRETVLSREDIRLDRTPTDEEINWLWQKVRTCLNTNRTTDNHNHHTSNLVNTPITNDPANPNITNHHKLPNPNATNPNSNPPSSNSATANNPVYSSVSIHYKSPNPSTTSHNNPASLPSTTPSYNKLSNPAASTTNGRPVITQTYIDGTTLVAGPGLKNHRPPVNSTYINNYMGTAMPARRRLVTMDTLGRMTQRRLPRRPMSGVSQPTAPTVSVSKNRVMSAPAASNRTSGAL